MLVQRCHASLGTRINRGMLGHLPFWSSSYVDRTGLRLIQGSYAWYLAGRLVKTSAVLRFYEDGSALPEGQESVEGILKN